MKETGLTGKRRSTTIAATPDDGKSQRKRRRNWENKGVKIDGEFFTNLSFADDIILCTEAPQELHIQQMIQELSDESSRMGLKMTIAKAKVMVVDNTPIYINNVLIETVEIYVYLGQRYSLKEKNQDKRDTTKNHGRLGCIRQTPGYLQKQPCPLPEETGVQLLHVCCQLWHMVQIH